jgi:hypothetical protein
MKGRIETMPLTQEQIESIRANARETRAIVDAYNSNILRSQEIEPTPERLQSMCGDNIQEALAAYKQGDFMRFDFE